MRLALALLVLLSGCKKPAPAAPSCESGDADACFDTARRLMETPGHAEEVRKLLARGCQLGSGSSCLGAAGLEPRERDALLARAATLLPAACDKGVALACEQLFTLSPGSDAGVRAHDLLADACDAGSQPSCHRLGSSLLDGRLGKSAPEEGEALLQRACTAGIAGACAELGMAYNFGKGLPQDPGKARLLMQRAGGLSRDAGT